MLLVSNVSVEPSAAAPLIVSSPVGASLALAVRHHKAAGHVICYDKSADARDEAKQIGIGDKIADTLEEAVRDADLVVLAVPVGVMGKVMEDIAPI